MASVRKREQRDETLLTRSSLWNEVSSSLLGTWQQSNRLPSQLGSGSIHIVTCEVA
jgi:hypothetical protein